MTLSLYINIPVPKLSVGANDGGLNIRLVRTRRWIHDLQPNPNQTITISNYYANVESSNDN